MTTIEEITLYTFIASGMIMGASSIYSQIRDNSYKDLYRKEIKEKEDYLK